MDIELLIDFVKFCDDKVPIDIDIICHTDMSDGKVLKIEGDKVELWHMYKGYEQWWGIDEIESAETNVSKYGLNRCLDMYIIKKQN